MKKVADGLPSLRTGCPRHPDGPVVMRCMRQDSTPPGPIAQSGQSNGLLSRLSWVRIPLGPCRIRSDKSGRSLYKWEKVRSSRIYVR